MQGSDHPFNALKWRLSADVSMLIDSSLEPSRLA
jgi:hypothetical protein